MACDSLSCQAHYLPDILICYWTTFSISSQYRSTAYSRSRNILSSKCKWVYEYFTQNISTGLTQCASTSFHCSNDLFGSWNLFWKHSFPCKVIIINAPNPECWLQRSDKQRPSHNILTILFSSQRRHSQSSGIGTGFPHYFQKTWL